MAAAGDSTAAALALRPGARVGRFELRRRIGQGGQATVWQAYDPQLDREVALKLLHVGPEGGAQQAQGWLQEARSVSRLTHPHIVPVFEAGLHEGVPYLVFEYVAGQTLAEYLRRHGALPAQQAVALMIEVLDALAAAHAAGIVHRDLKPSNVLIEASGRARVMDFGIAARLADGAPAAAAAAQGHTGGTPGYMSPEAARGEAPTPAMDIFSATVVLVEMLSGQRLIDEPDARAALRRVIREDLALPPNLGREVDDTLRAVLRRGLAREPAHRHASAQTMRQALHDWLHPQAPAPVEGSEGTSAAVQFLLRRMQHKSDFPALSGSIARILSISSSDRESVATLTNEILKDVALTQKLLRVVNTVAYARGGTVSTVSRAVTLVGFNGIRNMALSLVLLEHMQDQAHAALLKDEFLRSLMAGALAAELSAPPLEREEAFLAAMFQNLGRLLAEYYFPEEARAVRGLMAGKPALSEVQAAVQVLGVSYEQLGLGISRAWNLPQAIQASMHKPSGEPPARVPADELQRQGWLALAANAMADVLLQTEPQQALERAVQTGLRYTRVLGIEPRTLQMATQRARERLLELARAVDFRAAPGSGAARLLTPLPTTHRTVALHEVAPEQQEDDTMAGLELHATQPAAPAMLAGVQADTQRGAQMLAAGIQDITDAMVEDFKLADVLRMILETMYRAMRFRRIVFCMRDVRSDALTGRFGLGEGVEELIRLFRIPLQPQTPDLFSAVCSKGLDTMISDASEPRVASRLPAWYRSAVQAPTFLLLPLMHKGTPLGLIYADKAQPGQLDLDDKELALLRTLRNQAVMAFRQAG